jgi:hypothetical protein
MVGNNPVDYWDEWGLGVGFWARCLRTLKHLLGFKTEFDKVKKTTKQLEQAKKNSEDKSNKTEKEKFNDTMDNYDTASQRDYDRGAVNIGRKVGDSLLDKAVSKIINHNSRIQKGISNPMEND